MHLAPARLEEAPVEIVHEAGGAPIEVRLDRGPIRPERPSHHEAEDPAGRNLIIAG